MAEVYGVTTKALNQAVKRNSERFPADFAFVLTDREKSEVVTNCDHLARLKFSPALPRAFTEHGAIMAANVLKSSQAIQMSVFVIRAFVKMRAALNDTRELAKKLAALQRELKGRLDVHEAAKAQAASADVSALERELDELVYSLYGLMPEEIKNVEDSAK